MSNKIDDPKLDAARAVTQKLLRKDRVVQAACGQLVWSRRLHYAALHNLQGRLSELGYDDNPEVEECLAGSMAEVGMREFEIEELLKAIQGQTLPWLAAVISADNQRIEAEDAEEHQERLEARKKYRVPLGFCWDEGNSELSRGQVLALAGHSAAVKFLLRTAYESIHHAPEQDGYRPHVLRLSTDNFNKLVSKREKFRHRELPFSYWSGKLESQKKIGQVLQSPIQQMADFQLDLLIIDDLQFASQSQLAGTSMLRLAGRAAKNLSRWAADSGCAVLAGVPLGREAVAPDTASDFDWRELREWSTLRAISLTDGPYDKDFECETKNILLGDVSAAQGVDRKILE